MFGKKKKNQKKTTTKRDKRKALGTRLLEIFSRSGQGDSFYEELEDLLVEADLGAGIAVELVEELRRRVQKRKPVPSKEEILGELKEILKGSLPTVDLSPPPQGLSFYLVLGVNGVGKTTTIAKLAHRFKNQEGGVLLAAGDTFRAAAIEQLQLHGKNTGTRVVSQERGADPGAVIYDAIASAKSRGEGLILADTAGRMHNRVNLIQELKKIDRIVRERLGPEGYYRKILVIDATTGQNSLIQAGTFHEAIGIDAVIMTKFDSTAKGGLAAALGRKLGIPLAFLGRGEGMDDLAVFNPEDYLEELLAVC